MKQLISPCLCALIFTLVACGGSGSSDNDGSGSSSSSSSTSTSSSSSSSSGSVLVGPKVIGYIPSYKGLMATIDNTDLSQLTHINLSFLNPDASGEVISGDDTVCMESAVGGHVTGTELRYVVEQAHQAGVKVLVSVAGGVLPTCSGTWRTLLQPANRANLVNNLVQFVDNYDLDGLDVDIEGVILTNIDSDGNYTPFVQELRSAMDERGKLLTAATASYIGGMVPISSLQYFDFVTIMSYDAVGPTWGTPGGEHSTYEQAVAHIVIWQDRGLTKNQLVLGVPFYGWGFGSYEGSYSFADILALGDDTAADKDVVGTACSGCDYITYNGLPTIQTKTELALQEGSGVMIWELSHDASGANSLLDAINATINSFSEM